MVNKGVHHGEKRSKCGTKVNSPEVETSSRMRQPNKSRKSLAFTGESSSMSTLAEKRRGNVEKT